MSMKFGSKRIQSILNPAPSKRGSINSERRSIFKISKKIESGMILSF